MMSTSAAAATVKGGWVPKVRVSGASQVLLPISAGAGHSISAGATPSSSDKMEGEVEVVVGCSPVLPGSLGSSGILCPISGRASPSIFIGGGISAGAFIGGGESIEHEEAVCYSASAPPSTPGGGGDDDGDGGGGDEMPGLSLTAAAATAPASPRVRAMSSSARSSPDGHPAGDGGVGGEVVRPRAPSKTGLEVLQDSSSDGHPAAATVPSGHSVATVEPECEAECEPECDEEEEEEEEEEGSDEQEEGEEEGSD